MLKAIGCTFLAGLVILAGFTGAAVLSPDPLQGHLSRVLRIWGDIPAHEWDMRTAAEAGLTIGCQTAGLYSHHGFDYSDHLRIKFLNRPEWPDKRLVFTQVDGDGRYYVAHLETEQRMELCREIAERTASAGY